MRGSFTHRDNTGTNHFRFSGRIAGNALKPGNYRLDAAPRDAAGHRGRTVRSPFSILPSPIVAQSARAALPLLDPD